MLEIYRRSFGNDLSIVDFSGLDLSNIPLLGFRLKNSKDHFIDTVIQRRTFCGEGHSMRVCSVFWNSESSFYSASHDMTIREWNAPEYKDTIIGQKKESSHYIRCAQICPNNDNLIIYGGDDNTLKLLKKSEGIWECKEIAKSIKWIYSLAWGKKGDYVVIGDRAGNLKQINLNHSIEYQYIFHQNSIRKIDCSINDMIASGDDDGWVCIWKMGIKEPVNRFYFGITIRAIHWLNDKLLAVVAGNRIVYVDCSYDNSKVDLSDSEKTEESRQEILDYDVVAAQFCCEEDSYYCVLFSDDSLYIKKGSFSAGTYRMTDIASRKVDSKDLGVVSCIGWDKECKKIVFGSRNGSIWIGKLSLNEDVFDRIDIERISRGNLNSARCSSWSKKGTFFATGYDDGTIRIRTTDNYHSMSVLDGHRDSVKCLAWSRESEQQIVSGSDDGTVKLWSINGDFETLYEGTAPVNCLLWLNNELIICGTDKGEVIFINHVTKDTRNSKGGHTNRIYSLTRTPISDGFVSAGDDKKLCLWKVNKNGRYYCAQSIESGHEESIRSLATVSCISHSGIYSAGNDCNIIFHKYNSKNERIEIEPYLLPKHHDDFIYSICVSFTGEYIITGCTDSSIGIWDAKKNVFINMFKSHIDFIWNVATSPMIDDKYFMSSCSSDGLVIIWDISERCNLINEDSKNRKIDDTTLVEKVKHNEITVLANVDVVGCDLSKSCIDDADLKSLLINEGAVFD